MVKEGDGLTVARKPRPCQITDKMPSGGWCPGSIAYVLSGKLGRCFYDKVTVEEGAESLTLRMSNGQIFTLAVSEDRRRDSLGRPVRKR